MKYNVPVAIIIVQPNKKLTKEDFEKAREEYKSYIKITIDLESEIAALGGEYHADAEKKLLELGSKQKNIWGGGFNITTKMIETNAMLNIGPLINDNPEILDNTIREKFVKIAKQVFHEYIRN